MKNIKINILLALTLSFGLVSCNDDDNNGIAPEPQAPNAAQLLLNSIREDGGVPFDVNNPAVTCTEAQR